MNEARLTYPLFSPGTAANSLVDVFNKIVEKRRCQLNYVIPISDNGGSSSELIRFVGGPSEWWMSPSTVEAGGIRWDDKLTICVSFLCLSRRW